MFNIAPMIADHAATAQGIAAGTTRLTVKGNKRAGYQLFAVTDAGRKLIGPDALSLPAWIASTQEVFPGCTVSVNIF